jgi:hypothetical protein
MFRHLCVILREFQNVYFVKLHNFFKTETVKISIPYIC